MSVKRWGWLQLGTVIACVLLWISRAGAQAPDYRTLIEQNLALIEADALMIQAGSAPIIEIQRRAASVRDRAAALPAYTPAVADWVRDLQAQLGQDAGRLTDRADAQDVPAASTAAGDVLDDVARLRGALGLVAQINPFGPY
jgi:hypothetical protein